MNKVYLDLQVYEYISNNENILKKIEESKSRNLFYYSVAHVEEVYKSYSGETEEKRGITNKLRNCIINISENGILNPSDSCIIFKRETFDECYMRTVKYDTLETVKERSEYKQDSDKNGYDARNLFEGMTQNSETIYKDVWETKRVKEELKKANENNAKQIQMELAFENNHLLKTLEKHYGKENVLKIKQGLISNAQTKLIPDTFIILKNSFGQLEYVIEQLFFILSKCGFRREKGNKKANSGTYDIEHAIYGTFCDSFITDDSKFADKYKAVCYYLGVPTKIIMWDNFINENY